MSGGAGPQTQAPEPVLRHSPASAALHGVRTEWAARVTAAGAPPGGCRHRTAFSFLLPRQGIPGAHVHLPHLFCPVRLSQKQSYHPSLEEVPPFVKGPEGPWLLSLVFQGTPSSDEVVRRSIVNAAFSGWSWASRAVRKPFPSQEAGSERSLNLLKVPQRCLAASSGSLA